MSLEVLRLDEITDKTNQITISYNKISERFILKYGKESLLILALASRHYTIRRKLVFNLKYLYDKLNIPLNSKNRKDNVINSINKMFDTDLDSKTNIGELINVDYQAKTKQFLLLKDEEVDKLLSFDGRVDKYNLFNTYVVIKRYVNKDTGLSFPPISKIMEITNVGSNNTIIKYINILIDLKMIECSRSSDYIVTNDGVKRPNNEYKIL